MKIKIAIWGTKQNYSIYADDTTNEFTFGLEKKTDGVQTFVRQAIDIVKAWPDRVEDNKIVDGVKYKIAYEDETGARQLVGANATPETFSTLMYLIHKHEPHNEKFLLQEEMQKKMIADQLSALNQR
ncbi:MAG: hypothetical protein E7354_04140 [Clostridiales bacterium]|nr:hypothetical protein [Clostridiales bacterium]